MSQNYSLAFPFKFQILDQLIFLLQKSWTEAFTNSWKWNDEDIDQNTMDQMIKQQEDLNQQTTDQTDQKDQKWNQFFPTTWNNWTKLGESWKWNDEDIDQNTMDQMMKQREDFDQNQEVRMMNIRFTHMLHTYIIHTISRFF